MGSISSMRSGRYVHEEGINGGHPAEKILRQLRLNRNRTIPMMSRRLGGNQNEQTQTDTVLEEERQSRDNGLVEDSMGLRHEADEEASGGVARAPQKAAGNVDPELRSTSYGSTLPPPYSVHHGDT